jgi:hypothetical protein
MVPAGLEGFFEEVGKPGSDVSSPPPFEGEDIERLLAVAPKYGVEILPPPNGSVVGRRPPARGLSVPSDLPRTP